MACLQQANRRNCAAGARERWTGGVFCPQYRLAHRLLDVAHEKLPVGRAARPARATARHCAHFALVPTLVTTPVCPYPPRCCSFFVLWGGATIWTRAPLAKALRDAILRGRGRERAGQLAASDRDPREQQASGDSAAPRGRAPRNARASWAEVGRFAKAPRSIRVAPGCGRAAARLTRCCPPTPPSRARRSCVAKTTCTCNESIVG
jgi:hypothetical protein